MSEWIKCSERNPEQDGPYLCFCDGRYRAVRLFWKGDFKHGTAHDEEITHWMPLPEPPTE